MKKTNITLIVIVVVLAIIAIYFISKSLPQTPSATPSPTVSMETPSPTPSVTPSSTLTNGAVSTIGTSVGGFPVNAYHYGSTNSSAKEVLFIGGIHGGYEWNTVLVARELMNYLQTNPGVIPANVKVTVIPVLNPDGLNKVVGTTTGNFTAADVSTSQSTVVAGRFNGNNVDLNRNFDCDWQATGVWQSKKVSGGTSAFSEPESLAVKNYVTSNNPAAVVVWYSAAGGVFASNCHNGVSTETNSLVDAFAGASGYSANQSFDFYATTGDMTNWLAKINVPTISILLTNHTDTEWTKNLAGIKAVLNSFAK